MIKTFDQFNMNEARSGRKSLNVLIEDGHNFLEEYVAATFGDVKYDLDQDATTDGHIAFIEVYFDEQKCKEIIKALDADYKKAAEPFSIAAKKAGYTDSEITSGDDFISYAVTVRPSVQR